MLPLLCPRERVGFQSRAGGRHLDRPFCGAAELDDALRQEIHSVLGRIDHLVEQLVQADKARPLDIPMRLLGLVHEVNAVGKSRVEDLNDLSSRVCRQIILCLVHLGFLPFFNPSSLCIGLYGTCTTWPVSRAWRTPVEPGLVMHASGTIGAATVLSLLPSEAVCTEQGLKHVPRQG